MSGNTNTFQNQAKGASQAVADAAAATAKKMTHTGAGVAQTHAETSKEAILTGMKLAVDASDRSVKRFEEALTGDDATKAVEQSLRHVEAVSGAGTVMAQGFQEISREWMSWTKSSAEKSSGAIKALLECRSPQAFFEVQSRLMKENLEVLMNTFQKVSEISTDTSKRVTQKITATQPISA